MTRATASFRFRFTEPLSVERILSAEFHAPTEDLEERVESFFEPPQVGAREPGTREVDGEVLSALEEVREQFLLRRGISRAEMHESEIGEFSPLEGAVRGSMREFTGLEFETLQPEPVEPLRMRLENPPVDLAPSIEAPVLALAMLRGALAEFPPDGPPVPELPDRQRG